MQIDCILTAIALAIVIHIIIAFTFNFHNVLFCYRPIIHFVYLGTIFIFSARCNSCIYISRLCYDANVRVRGGEFSDLTGPIFIPVAGGGGGQRAVVLNGAPASQIQNSASRPTSD